MRIDDGETEGFDEGRRKRKKLEKSEYTVPAPKSQYFMSFGRGLFLRASDVWLYHTVWSVTEGGLL